MEFFESLVYSFIKFNDHEAVAKELTALFMR